MSTPLCLRPLDLADEPAARLAHAELALDDFDFLLGVRSGEPWSAYLARLKAERRGEDLPDGWVPATFLVADVDGDLVGRVSIRHVLNARLAAVGGHVGYGVRPGFRRLGHATRMLQLALERLGDLGVERALVTCDVDNTGSAATILSCGGTPAAPTPATADHQPDRRFWIDTRQPQKTPTESGPGMVDPANE